MWAQNQVLGMPHHTDILPPEGLLVGKKLFGINKELVWSFRIPGIYIHLQQDVALYLATSLCQ